MSPVGETRERAEAEAAGSELLEELLDRMELWVSGTAAEDARDAFLGKLEELFRSRPEPLQNWIDRTLAGSARGLPERAPLRALISRLNRRNPFLVLDARESSRIEKFFRQLLGEARSLLERGPTDRSAELRALDEKLGTFARSLPPSARLLVPSANYSAALQLEVLGLDVTELKAPVLDLGCGNPPQLLAFLKQHGLDATGFDRDGAEGIVTADWLEYDFAPDSWATILSHLAFSLHFLHHHLAPGSAAAAYAKKYMELLRSLRPSGTFAYVPGLPFIERLLPKREYRISKNPLDTTLADGLAPFTHALREPVSYACRVERLE